ncbi:putative disease resistance protein [Fagus crenata]
MAESVVSGVVSRLGDLLLQEANFLFDVSDQVEQLQTELQRMQCFLKDADARQDESELVRQWVAEIRELAYDADDIIGTYEIKVASRRGGGIQKILKSLLSPSKEQRDEIRQLADDEIVAKLLQVQREKKCLIPEVSITICRF